MNHHASVVALGEAGVMIEGSPGAGKSALALALVERWQRAGHFARLVADDQVHLRAAGGRLVATAPAHIAGAAEVRAIGIVSVPHLPAVRISLVVALVPVADSARLPEPAGATRAGIVLPLVHLPERNTTANVLALQAAPVLRA